jgi:hypothetical protein
MKLSSIERRNSLTPHSGLECEQQTTAAPARRFFPKLQNPRPARSLELPHRLNTYRHTPLELLFQAAKNSRRYADVRRRLRQSYLAVQRVGEYRRQKLPHLFVVRNPFPGQHRRPGAFRDHNSLKHDVNRFALPRSRQFRLPFGVRG